MSPFFDAMDSLPSTAFRHELPCVDDAFDATVMQRHLQAALLNGNGNVIVRCERRQAVYEPDNGCVVRYALDVRDRAGRPLGPALASACLFPNTRSSRDHFEKRLRPLAAAMRGRPEVAAFLAPAAVLEPLPIAVRLFPIDADLPTLVAATDPAAMLETLRGTIDWGSRAPFDPVRCHVSVAHYPRQHHCVLRYTLEEEGDALPVTVFGKIAWDDRAALTASALPELRERLDRMRTRRFAVPRLLGFVEALRLVLLEPMPGSPLVLPLLRERLGPGGGALRTPTLEDAVEQAAAVAAGLHGSGIARGRQRGIQKEQEELDHALTMLERISPSLGGEYREWVARVKAVAAESEPLPLCFSHGDFSPSQILFTTDRCSLIDFDTICQAEPALDLGQFLAYLRLSARKAAESSDRHDTTERMCARFVDAYVNECGLGPGAETLLRTRVRLYEIVSLLRIVFHSWRKFKGERLAFAVELVRDRLGALAGRTT
jgi:Phosphotransferase enzyme family